MRSRTSFVVMASLSLSLLGGGCPLDDQNDDDTPPRVLGVEPAALVVPVTTSFRVQFSEALNPRSVVFDPALENLSVLLAPRFVERSDGPAPLLDDDFFGDLNNGTLSEDRSKKLVAVDASLDASGAALQVTPRGPLLAATAYTLVVNAVRDVSGNPLVDSSGVKAPFLWEFSTDAGPPAVADVDLGDGTVFPNRRHIRVTFNQVVQGIGPESLSIEGSPAPNVESILVDEVAREGQTVSVASILLGSLTGGCERLAPGGSYALVATSQIRAATGQTLADYREEFTVKPSCDTQVNQLLAGSLQAIAADTTAVIQFQTTKASSTEVRFGIAGGALDCEGASCPQLGNTTVLPDDVHVVSLTGLVVDRDYAFQVSAEDEVGSVATASGTFRTAPLPKVSLNEVMANPDTADDRFGEYIEVASFDVPTVDLSGWSIRLTKLPVGSSTPSVTQLPTTGASIEPGKFLVLGRTDFDAAHYPGLEEVNVLRLQDFPALVNDTSLLFELIDAAGRPVSTLTAPKATSARAVARRSPEVPDVPDNVCGDFAPTPGRANGVPAVGCGE